MTEPFIYLNMSEAEGKKLGAVWNQKRKAFRLPRNLWAMRELEDHGHQVPQDIITNMARRYQETMQKKQYTGSQNYDPRLRDYQVQDIHFLSTLPHAAIFHSMRLGKTAILIKVLQRRQLKHGIVVVPASILHQWERQFHEWDSGQLVYVASGTKLQRQKVYENWEINKGILIISKDLFKLKVEDFMKIKVQFFVVDEAHFLSSRNTAQSQAIQRFARNANHRYVLTGTPTRNSGEDIWGILNFLYPAVFPGYWQFVDRYFKTWQAPWGATEVKGYKRKEELQGILSLISVQRKYEDVMQFVPPKTYETISLEMPPKQRKAYNEMLEFFTVEESGLDAQSPLTQLIRLRQLCLSPEIVNVKAPSAKEKWLIQWVKDFPDNQVIIFSNFSSYLKHLHKKLKGSQLITGETPSKKRQQTVDDFQNGKCNIILANIQAAGTGLTLDAGSTIIFLDRDFVYSSNEQAEARILATHEGSNLQAHIIDVECSDSVDQKINAILKQKKSVTDVINNYGNIKDFLKG